MEFPFNLNNLFGDVITRIDRNVSPYRRHADGFDRDDLCSQLCKVIDMLGEMSAKAQGLKGAITGGRKLELSDHILYIFMDRDANKGRGAAVGLLKLGPKKLFVYDHNGSVHEMEPICVLDFYVHESRQRMGCGKMLFEYMLQDLGVKPQHLAVDKPSYKFSQFLQKHYNLRAIIPQVNNFVIFDGFFRDRSDTPVKRRNGMGRPPLHPFRRNNFHEENTYSKPSRTGDNYGLPPSHPGRTAEQRINNLPPSGRSSRVESIQQNISEPQQKKHNSKFWTEVFRQLDIPVRPPSGRSTSSGESRVQNEPLHLDLRGMGANASSYSRHNEVQPGSRPDSGSHLSRQGSQRGQNRNQNASDTRTATPPLLRREEPPGTFNGQLNLHQDYLGRDGRMRVNGAVQRQTTLPTIPVGPPKTKTVPRGPPMDIFLNSAPPRAWKPPSDVTSWTAGMFGMPRGYHTMSTRSNTHTRLW